MSVSALIADDELLSELWCYWARKCAGRAMPSRADIDPVEIPRLLPFLQIVERTSDGRYRYRLTGTAIVELYGRELTGCYVDDVVPETRRSLAEHHYGTVFATGRPVFVTSRYQTPIGAELNVRRIILPLSRGGAETALLLMAQSVEFPSRTPGRLDDTARVDVTSDVIQYLA